MTPYAESPARCRIQWIGPDGAPTPDDNPAIGTVQLDRRTVQIDGRGVRMAASDVYPICAAHYAVYVRENLAGEHWTFTPYAPTVEYVSAEGKDADVPLCALAMGCLCVGHARGNPASDACDTRE